MLAGEVPACLSSRAGVLGTHSLTWMHAGPLVHGVPSLGHGPGWNVTSCGMQEDLRGHVQLTDCTGDGFGRLSCFLSQIALRSPFSSPLLQSMTPTFPLLPPSPSCSQRVWREPGQPTPGRNEDISQMACSSGCVLAARVVGDRACSLFIP